NDFALHRLFLGRVRDDDAALRLLVSVDALHDDAVMQGAKFQLCHGDLFRLGRAGLGGRGIGILNAGVPSAAEIWLALRTVKRRAPSQGQEPRRWCWQIFIASS